MNLRNYAIMQMVVWCWCAVENSQRGNQTAAMYSMIIIFYIYLGYFILYKPEE